MIFLKGHKRAGAVVTRVAFIGAGGIAERHIDAIRRTGVGDVIVLASRSPERAKALADKKAIRRHTASVDEAIHDSDVDTVVVAYPTFLHASIALQALRAGKHVVVEKPIAGTVAEADEMIATATAASRSLLVCQVRRFWPCYSAMQRIIAGGTLGPVTRLAFDFQAFWHWRDRGWRIERPGGYFLDMHVHEIDLLSWWAGASPLSVSAAGDNVAEREGVVAVTFTQALGVLTFSGRVPGKTYPAASTTYAQVTGERGWAELLLAGGSSMLTVNADGGGERQERGIAEENRLGWDRMWTAFGATLNAGAPAPLLAQEASASLATTLAAAAELEKSSHRAAVMRPVAYSGSAWA